MSLTSKQCEEKVKRKAAEKSASSSKAEATAAKSEMEAAKARVSELESELKGKETALKEKEEALKEKETALKEKSEVEARAADLADKLLKAEDSVATLRAEAQELAPTYAAEVGKYATWAYEIGYVNALNSASVPADHAARGQTEPPEDFWVVMETRDKEQASEVQEQVPEVQVEDAPMAGAGVQGHAEVAPMVGTSASNAGADDEAILAELDAEYAAEEAELQL